MVPQASQILDTSGEKITGQNFEQDEDVAQWAKNSPI